MSEAENGAAMRNGGDKPLDVVVVGAGFAGVYAVYRYRRKNLSVLGFEGGSDVGGTWYHNRYPGARCDVRRIDYSYSFSPDLHQEWRWTETYAAQPEILRYIQHVAERYDLRRDIVFNTRIVAARWNEDARLWRVTTDAGKRVACRFVVLATGALSAPKIPDFPGLADFRGARYQTARWPHDLIDFTGKRVGIFGTGSSGVQCIPVIAEHATHLTVFQRTPPFSTPARNGPMDEKGYAAVRARYEDYRADVKAGWSGQISASLSDVPGPAATYTKAEQRDRFERAWATGGLAPVSIFSDVITNQESNDIITEFIREKIRQIVKDPETAERLCPYDHPVVARRPCIDTNYYETYNRDNVTLVDVRTDPVDRIRPDGIQTRNGFHPVDAIVFATGFDAFTGQVAKMDIRNAAGERLIDYWKDGARSYIGMSVTGFPNLFLVTGPGSPSVLANVILAGEHDVDWIGDCIAWLGEHHHSRIEATAQAEADWVQHVAEIGAGTLYPKANSWYMGANIAGKPRVFLPFVGGFGNFANTCAAIAREGYRGFSID